MGIIVLQMIQKTEKIKNKTHAPSLLLGLKS
jgi:hypothetical protein